MRRLQRPSDVPGPRRLLAAFLGAIKNCSAVLFPPLCIVCQNPLSADSPWLCDRCCSRLEENRSSRDPCPHCSQNRRIAACDCAVSWDHPFETMFSVFDFDETMKAIVHEFKYGGLKKLAFDLARTYARCVPFPFFEGIDIVVPVPLHFFRSIQRGYNQADCIARGFISGSGCGATLAAGAVRRSKMTRTQTALSRDQRVKNVHGAFAVPAGKISLVKYKGVILVDDIVTTGATTGQCAAALLDAGAKRVRVLSLARD